MRTWGGGQFWSDVLVRPCGRIQQHVWTERYRVLDPRNRCLAAGTYEVCLEKLVRIATQPEGRDESLQSAIRAITPDSAGTESEVVTSGEATATVLLLHGILRTSRCFLPLRNLLNEHGMRAYSLDYPSTQMTIEQAARQLQRVLESLETDAPVHLVGHSMGGLVIRAWYGQFGEQAELSRLGRIVMLGTPNHGAELADWLRLFPPYRLLFGRAGLQLGTKVIPCVDYLPIPPLPIGIIVGGRGQQTRGYNPLLPGDNDGTVTCASAQLAEQADFLRVPALHMNLMRHPQAMAATLRFLQHGHFLDETAP